MIGSDNLKWKFVVMQKRGERIDFKTCIIILLNYYSKGTTFYIKWHFVIVGITTRKINLLILRAISFVSSLTLLYSLVDELVEVKGNLEFSLDMSNLLGISLAVGFRRIGTS